MRDACKIEHDISDESFEAIKRHVRGEICRNKNNGGRVMSEVLENIKTRRSVRKFRPDPVPKDILDKIIEAGLYAPQRHEQAVADNSCNYE